jgi:hypothetical protein
MVNSQPFIMLTLLSLTYFGFIRFAQIWVNAIFFMVLTTVEEVLFV